MRSGIDGADDGAGTGTLGSMTFVTGPSRAALRRPRPRACGGARPPLRHGDRERLRPYGERAYIARTLQESLAAAELPEIPGIETAACSALPARARTWGRPLRPLLERRPRPWTVVVGDVCGKADAARRDRPRRPARAACASGSRAAAFTSERGAAAPADRPALLHRRLRVPRVDGYRGAARLRERRPPAPAARAPGRRRHSGGRTRTLLGVVPDPTFEDRSIELAPGDALGSSIRTA